MKVLVEEHFPKAKKKIRLVMDNLNTHVPGAALYEAFSPGEAWRIFSRLEFHYTPKHASWLNMWSKRSSRCWPTSAWEDAG